MGPGVEERRHCRRENGAWDSDPGGEAEDVCGLLQDVLLGLQRLGQKKRRQQQQQPRGS